MDDLFWIDDHCHLADRKFTDLAAEFDLAVKAGIKLFVSSALSSYEIAWHRNFNSDYPHYRDKMRWCAGIHPYYEASSEKDLELVVELCENQEIIAVGEIGMDKRNPYLEWQERIFLRQLEIASAFDLPVYLHIVKSYYEVYKLIKDNFPDLTYILHGFNGSLEIVESFSGFNSFFSLNARLPGRDVLEKIGQEKKLLLETDAPYANPFPGRQYNHLGNLLHTAEKVADILNLKSEELRQIQWNNYRIIYGITGAF